MLKTSHGSVHGVRTVSPTKTSVSKPVHIYLPTLLLPDVHYLFKCHWFLSHTIAQLGLFLRNILVTSSNEKVVILTWTLLCLQRIEMYCAHTVNGQIIWKRRSAKSALQTHPHRLFMFFQLIQDQTHRKINRGLLRNKAMTK